MSVKNTVLQFVSQYFVPFLGWLKLSNNKYCNVIYYHDVVKSEEDGYSFMKMPLSQFKQQMEYIKKRGYETLRFDDLNNENKVSFRKKRILIAFDDGWLSNFTEIYEFMKSQGLHYNIFLTMGEIGNNPDYLTWDMVREMRDSGICGFGAHTYTHPDMSNLSKIDLNHEISDANNLFKAQLGYSPTDFCYPFGYYSSESNEFLTTSTDYKRIYQSDQIFSYDYNGRIIFGRNGISMDFNPKFFVKVLNGYNNISKEVFLSLLAFREHLQSIVRKKNLK